MTSPLISTESLTHGTELNAVYAIARIVAETFDTEAGLDAVFRLARTIFIFDTVASTFKMRRAEYSNQHTHVPWVEEDRERQSSHGESPPLQRLSALVKQSFGKRMPDRR